MSIQSNIQSLKATLPATCKLVVVSKTQAADSVTEAYHTPHRAFGENKVQELVGKAEALPRDIEWHMIGHLQRNKVKYIAPFVNLIHGVDSAKLLEEIDRQGEKVQRIIPCLLQVHIAAEETKFGFSDDELRELVSSDGARQLRHIRVRGLMGMATFTDNTDQVRSEFRGLRQVFEQLKSFNLPTNFSMEELSMGMSGDYRIAVEEGSTIIRIGTAIFGERPRKPE